MRAATARAGPQCPPSETVAREPVWVALSLPCCPVSWDARHPWCVTPASKVCTGLFIPLAVSSRLPVRGFERIC